MTKYCIIKHDDIREQRLQGENGSMWKMETLCIEHLQNSRSVEAIYGTSGKRGTWSDIRWHAVRIQI